VIITGFGVVKYRLRKRAFTAPARKSQPL